MYGELGDLPRARKALQEAWEIDASDPELGLTLASARFEQGHLEQAQELLERLVPAEPHLAAEALYLRALIAELMGRPSEALFAQAAQLDPALAVAPPMEEAAFEAVVEQALADLPPQVQSVLTNIPVLVRELPPLEDVIQGGLSPSLLGLFVGTPPRDLSVLDPLTEPPRILLFKRNLERTFAGARLREEIRTTVIHEVGHALGLSEDELHARGLA